MKPSTPRRQVRCRPQLELLESRLQPGSIPPRLGSILADPAWSNLDLPPVPEHGQAMRVLPPDPTRPQDPSGQAGTSLITAPSAGSRLPAGDMVVPTVSHSQADATRTRLEELPAPNAAATHPSRPAFATVPTAARAGAVSARSTAPPSARSVGLTARPITTQGPHAQVVVIPDAVKIQPMRFATLKHWDSGSRTDGGPDSSVEWTTYITGTDTSAVGAKVATDQGSNSYVTGSRGEGDDMVAFVAKYDNTGRQIYYTEFQAVDPDPNYTYGRTEAHAIAVDPVGFAYVTGTATRLETGNNQAFAMKLDQFGNVIAGYGGGIAATPNSDSAGNGIAVDAAGRATLTGTVQISDTETEVFALKFDIAGDLPLYAAAYRVPGFDGSAGQAVVLDATADNAYIVGSILPSGQTEDDIFAFKVDNTGLQAGRHVSWALSALNDGEDALTGVGVNDAGNAFVVGTVIDMGQPVAYLAEINAMGNNFVYTDVFDDTASGNAISLDGDNAYFTGGLPGDDGNIHAFVAKADSLGIVIDATVLAGDTTETGQGISFSNGNAFAVGTTSSTDLSTDGTMLNGKADAFLTKVTDFN